MYARRATLLTVDVGKEGEAVTAALALLGLVAAETERRLGVPVHLVGNGLRGNPAS